MGPPQAKRVLKEAAAMGCDGAVLVSDRKFGGADTWATSYTLAAAITKIGGFDLIITGERATDGDTAQVGPGIAAHLDLPLATYVSTIREVRDGRIYPERLTEEGYEQLSLPLPCLLTVVKEIGVPRLPTLRGKIKSRELEIPLFSTENMDLREEYLGLKGSPTRVVKIESPKLTRGGRLVDAMEGGEAALQSAVDAFMLLLEERGII
jgi:electron transfer flavoprotein beta subunit